MYTVNQFKANKYLGSWTNIETIESALEIINSMVVSGKGCTFNIENQSGTVVEVVKK